MSDIKEQLYRCFYSLDENFFNDFIENIDKRIVFQKYGLFFADIFGLRYGAYSLYIHGPYNSSLATVGYEFADDYRLKKKYLKTLPNVVFSQNANNIITFMKNLLSITNIDFLEVFSTYFYLKNYKDLTEEEILNRVNKIKREIIEKNNIDLQEMTNRYNQLRQYINDSAKSQILA